MDVRGVRFDTARGGGGRNGEHTEMRARTCFFRIFRYRQGNVEGNGGRNESGWTCGARDLSQKGQEVAETASTHFCVLVSVFPHVPVMAG
jgi:hypothetical protein